MNAAWFIAATLMAVSEPAPRITAMCGGGELTAGWTPDGVLAALRWREAGGVDQLTQRGTGGGSGGGRWGVTSRGATYWAGDANARAVQSGDWISTGMVRSDIAWDGTSTRVEQRAFVPDGTSVLITRIEMDGNHPEPAFVWRSEWSPAARHIPEIPFGDGALDLLNGFATVADADRGRVWYVRPADAGQDKLRRARALLAESASIEAWADALGEGVWIGIGRATEIRLESDPPVGAVLGSVRSILFPPVEKIDGKWRAWLAVAVAATFDEASRALDQSSAALGYADVPAGAAGARRLPRRARIPEAHRDGVSRHWGVVQTLGSLRGLDAAPPAARDFPRYGSWVAMAFTAWGDPAGAGPILDRYLGSVRMSDSAGQPYGSLAESFYANGEPASPRFIVDDRGPARLLFAAERYVMSLPDDQRRAWITRHADRIRAAAEFLTGWADRRRGAPLWCADPVGLSDAVSQSRVFDQYAGVSAAIRVFRAIGQDVPETWTQRRETLGGLADWILTTRSAAWSPARALVLEFRDLPGPSHEALSAQTLAALGAGRDHDYEQGAMVAAQAVLLIEAADPGVEGLDREQVWEAIDGSSYADVAPLPCDSYASGLALFAAAVLTTP